MNAMIERGREVKGDNLRKGFRATLGLADDDECDDFVRIAMCARSRSSFRPEAIRTCIAVGEFVCEESVCSGRMAVRVPLHLQAPDDGRWVCCGCVVLWWVRRRCFAVWLRHSTPHSGHGVVVGVWCGYDAPPSFLCVCVCVLCVLFVLTATPHRTAATASCTR